MHNQDEQAARVLDNLRKLADPLEKFVALNALHDRNEALFFRVVCDNVDEIQPLIYTLPSGSRASVSDTSSSGRAACSSALTTADALRMSSQLAPEGRHHRRHRR